MIKWVSGEGEGALIFNVGFTSDTSESTLAKNTIMQHDKLKKRDLLNGSFHKSFPPKKTNPYAVG